MDPTQIIQELCARHGVSPSFGNRLRPLIERAQVVAPDVRERIMDLVERSFAEEARRVVRERQQRRERRDGDWRVLTSVAAILHDWDPPGWLEHWKPAPPEDPGD